MRPDLIRHDPWLQPEPLLALLLARRAPRRATQRLR